MVQNYIISDNKNIISYIRTSLFPCYVHFHCINNMFFIGGNNFNFITCIVIRCYVKVLYIYILFLHHKNMNNSYIIIFFMCTKDNIIVTMKLSYYMYSWENILFISDEDYNISVNVHSCLKFVLKVMKGVKSLAVAQDVTYCQ